MMASLTVLQLLPDLNVGGVERGTIEIAEALVKNGHRALVVSNHGRLVDELVAVGGKHIPLPIGKKSLFTLRYIWGLRRIINIHKVDIVHARSRLPAWIGWLAIRGLPAANRPRWITTVHGPYAVNRYSEIMVSGERVIAISEFIRAYILENYPTVNAEDITVIHRGVDARTYNKDFSPGGDWLREFKTQNPSIKGKKILVFPGRLTRWKGQIDFINLIAKLRTREQNVVGFIVGGQSDKRSSFEKELQDAVSRQGLQSDIVFLGNRTDLKEILSIADISFSLPNIPEAFGRTTLEALSLGTPVIGFNEGGTGEVLSNIFPAGLVEPGSLDLAVEKTIAFLKSPPVVWKNDSMTTANMQRETLATYSRLLDKPSPL